MRAKIMVLSGNDRSDSDAEFAEQILTDVSAAFGHTFALMREKIGEASLAAHGEALTDQAADACLQCQAVFACGASPEDMAQLYDALNLPLRIRSFSVPEALCGRHETPVSLYVGAILSLDEETLRQAMRCAFSFAQEQECRLCSVAPNGEAKADWEAAQRVQEAENPSLAASSLSAPEAAAAMITAPERMGLVLCPPYAGSILLAVGEALCGHPDIRHEMAFDGEIGVFSPAEPAKEGQAFPFSVALALAKLLRYALRLPREAACVEAAVGNVMSAASRPGRAEDEPAPDPARVLDMICEQIAVAGELMRRGGI